MSSSRLPRFLVPLLLFLGAAALLFARIDVPDRIYFDEVYYVGDARNYLDMAVEDSFAVHPPVGKWIVAGSIALLGDDPFGWRASGALAGALTVLLSYLIGTRLFRRAGPAAFTALLVLTDGLFFVQARIAMLDIYLALFVALGTWLLLVDRDRTVVEPLPRRYSVPAGASEDHPGDAPIATTSEPDVVEVEGAPRPTFPRRRHPFRALAGVAFGLAVATKWSGLYALAAAGLLALGWELLDRKRVTGRSLTAWRPAVASLFVGLVLVPIGVYAVSYVPWLANYEHTTEGDDDCPEGVETGVCDVALPGRLAGLVRYHEAVLRFHATLEAEHPYRAPAYSWPLLARPVVYYWETCSEDRQNRVPKTDDETGEVTIPDPCVVEREEAAEILAVGNPALWWSFVAASVLLAAGAGMGDRRAVLITLFWALQFLPWLLTPRPAFLFYMVPNVVFLALGVAYATVWLDERRPLLRPWLYAVLGAGLGTAAGYGVEWWTEGASAESRWVGTGVGLLFGALMAGARLYARREDQAAPDGRRPGTWVAVGISVLAVGMFVYFLPVWTGVPLPDGVIKQRWWFRGWI